MSASGVFVLDEEWWRCFFVSRGRGVGKEGRNVVSSSCDDDGDIERREHFTYAQGWVSLSLVWLFMSFSIIKNEKMKVSCWLNVQKCCNVEMRMTPVVRDILLSIVADQNITYVVTSLGGYTWWFGVRRSKLVVGNVWESLVKAFGALYKSSVLDLHCQSVKMLVFAYAHSPWYLFRSISTATVSADISVPHVVAPSSWCEPQSIQYASFL